MTDKEFITQSAGAAADAIEACVGVIGHQDAQIADLQAQVTALTKKASALEADLEVSKSKEAAALAKEASLAPAKGLNEELLMKTSGALHEVYGSPSNASAEVIAERFRNDPDMMLKTIGGLIQKVSSFMVASPLGVEVPKKASAEEATASSRPSFERIFEQTTSYGKMLV